MSITDEKKKIFAFIRRAKPRSEGHIIKSQDEFLDGLVAEVEFKDGGASAITQFVVITGRYQGYADTQRQLIQQMNAAAERASAHIDWKNQVFNIGGLIALILVMSSAYLYVYKGQDDIPESLKAILLTIVGFYFGGYIQQSKKKKEANQ